MNLLLVHVFSSASYYLLVMIVVSGTANLH